MSVSRAAGPWTLSSKRQTRAHKDLDVLVAGDDLERALGALAELGFQIYRDDEPFFRILRDAGGRLVDLHLVAVLAEGLMVEGRNGRRVRCLAPERGL